MGPGEKGVGSLYDEPLVIWADREAPDCLNLKTPDSFVSTVSAPPLVTDP